jgi:hypothetical protein
LTAAFGIIGGSVGLNALIKSNREKGFLKSHVPKPTILHINTDDVLFSGIVVAVVCASIGAIATASLQVMILPSWRRRWADKTKNLRGGMMLFFTLWLLAAHIPFTLFFATRDAIVNAWIMGKPVPAAKVAEAAHHLGSTAVYKDVYYLRLLAILPWVTFFFASISVVVIFTTPPMSSSTDRSSPARDAMSEKMRAEEIA